jgi:hypothetical protein
MFIISILIPTFMSGCKIFHSFTPREWWWLLFLYLHICSHEELVHCPAWLHFCHHFNHTWLSQVVIAVCSSSAFSLHQYLMHRLTLICALSWFSLHQHRWSYFDVRTQAMLVTQDRFTVRYIWSSIHPLSWFSHYISLCTLELRSCSPPFAIYLGSPCINIILHI